MPVSIDGRPEPQQAGAGTAEGPARGSAPAGAPRSDAPPRGAPQPQTEIGGPNGPEPTRYGDWERSGRCIDF